VAFDNTQTTDDLLNLPGESSQATNPSWPWWETNPTWPRIARRTNFDGFRSTDDPLPHWWKCPEMKNDEKDGWFRKTYDDD
jgi:hypothetical protein